MVSVASFFSEGRHYSTVSLFSVYLFKSCLFESFNDGIKPIPPYQILQVELVKEIWKVRKHGIRHNIPLQLTEDCFELHAAATAPGRALTEYINILFFIVVYICFV